MTRVAVIGGGENPEHDVSLASAASVCSALRSHDRFEVVALTIQRDGRWTDARGARITLAEAVDELQRCGVVFPVVHGPRGEDGTLAALLDLAHVPYVGSGLRAGALAMDKVTTKLIAESVGVRTARAARGTFPAVVKPSAAGSSFGVARVDDESELTAALEVARGFDDRVLVEEYIVGREIDVAVVTRADGSRMVSAPLEIVVSGAVFDSETKYDGTADFRVPAALTPAQQSDLERQALAVYDALGCSGVARVDFFLTHNGFVLNEVNTVPGLTARSQVPRMFEATGIPYAELVADLVDAALGRVLA
ncbi:D-alanine-D-alanine ligase [Microbacteriaceae bacterium SG_E_30_P1]|uniref:D-alanine--D-alanine ligase n=1 Tax=Antiquaquibacter oligotrophicus TaxID=2880260 RepID=A0ABT6KTP5_9MICO|nr:D-alanine--D-alanine ligase family protein [Antiquaquibacter oligotrophicus]MDH6182567.1 D-alanine-D-alanine ligase [Antiquaquibacter oligotrophicus]UDF14466.1 D-alanine--D-alanine ligase [Antiquaquibacter oligotrophicus]